jgi:hypothetical protein
VLLTPIRNSTDVKTTPSACSSEDEHDSQWADLLDRMGDHGRPDARPRRPRDWNLLGPRRAAPTVRSMLAERASLMQPSGVER